MSSYNTVGLPADFCCAPLSTTFFLFLSKLHFNTSRFHFNPLQLRGSYSATSNMELVHWPLMGGLLHLVQQGGDWVGPQPPRPLLAVPNITVHPSMARVPITVLLYNGMLLRGIDVPLKG